MITNSFDSPVRPVAPTKKRNATIHLVQSPRFARTMAKLLLLGLASAILAMAFLPWQQTSRGTGEVIAFEPQERQQDVKARVKGVVVEIAPELYDGAYVERDQFLMRIQPFAADMIAQLDGQKRELELKASAYKAKAEVYEQNIIEFTELQKAAIDGASELVAAAEAKLKATKKKVLSHEAKERQTKLNRDRQHRLFKQGVTAEKELEKFQMSWEVASADLDAAREDVVVAEREVAAKKQDLTVKQRESQTKIEDTKSYLEDAKAAAATVAKEIRDIEIKKSQMDGNIVKAPRDGRVYRLNVNELGATIKEGDSLLTIIPETKNLAVALMVNGNDMPLVQVGQEVRLQFEGWPAVQFAGWPSVAVGTFSGYVATVDATDNGKGEFRILITPNEDEEQAWPSDRYLRQGVRVNGWVMLREVSLGYEIWRQLNGFPVIVSEKEPTAKEKIKTPKLPK